VVSENIYEISVTVDGNVEGTSTKLIHLLKAKLNLVIPSPSQSVTDKIDLLLSSNVGNPDASHPYLIAEPETFMV